jgi:hypothetical protein
MALLSNFDHVTSSVLRSKWTVILELVLILFPTSLVAAPALLLLLLVILVNPIAVFPLTLTAIGGIWGLASLWRYLFSLFRPLPTPRWAGFGLIAGSLTVIAFFLLGKNKGWSPALTCILVAMHWFWLKRQNIVLSVRTPNAS